MSEWHRDPPVWRAGPGPAGTIFTWNWFCACGVRGAGGGAPSRELAEWHSSEGLRAHQRDCQALTGRPPTRLRPAASRPDLAALRQAWVDTGTPAARKAFLAAVDGASEAQLAALAARIAAPPERLAPPDRRAVAARWMRRASL